MVDVRLHESLEEFRTIAEPLYWRDPVLHTIDLTLLGGSIFPDDSLLLTVWDDGTPVGAALQTPPYPLVCNGIPAIAIEVVAARLVEHRTELAGVRGIRSIAVEFADAWQTITGRPATIDTEERLYRLGTLRAPGSVAGSERVATADDRDLLAEWVSRFFGEAFSRVPNDAGSEFVGNADRAGNRFVLWEVGGVPVSTAMLRAPAAGVSRIGPVFTPREYRNHGYGSAVTAAAADLALHRGVTDVVLFADLANPTSNAIYQRIGFVAVADSVRIDFGTVD